MTRMIRANKCPTCPQCSCLISYAMMCGVEEGRYGTLGSQTNDVLMYCLVGCLWLNVIVLVGTVALRERCSLVIFQVMDKGNTVHVTVITTPLGVMPGDCLRD